MPSRSVTRTQPCSVTQARMRLQHARKFLEVAEITALRRLLSLKDEAHYGLFDVSGHDLQAALRQARTLVDFAAEVIQRRPA